MTESNFEYDLDIIDNTVIVEYEGLNNGRGIFSYNFDQPLDSVTVAREEDTT